MSCPSNPHSQRRMAVRYSQLTHRQRCHIKAHAQADSRMRDLRCGVFSRLGVGRTQLCLEFFKTPCRLERWDIAFGMPSGGFGACFRRFPVARPSGIPGWPRSVFGEALGGCQAARAARRPDERAYVFMHVGLHAAERQGHHNASDDPTSAIRPLSRTAWRSKQNPSLMPGVGPL